MIEKVFRWLLLIVLIGGIGLIVWRLFAQANEFVGLEQAKDLERRHVKGKVYYPSEPPMGGNHIVVWQNCGIYKLPVVTENAVHSLEHGAVWITYRQDLSKTEQQHLEKLVLGKPYVLLTPYTKQPTAISLIAWEHRLRLKSVDDDVINRFIKKFAGSLEVPEPAGPCIGGLGKPRW
jgi:Protein of unknown function (DUF3105)